MNKSDSGIILCGVCKNTAGTVPVIRAAFEELASKAGVRTGAAETRGHQKGAAVDWYDSVCGHVHGPTKRCHKKIGVVF